MSWEDLFPKHILQRGRVYFDQGRVTEYRKTRNKNTYLVQGSRRYWVQLAYNGNNVWDMICSCPYAMQDNYCKHMAAAMYAFYQAETEREQKLLEKQRLKEEQERKRIEAIEKIQLPQEVRELCLKSGKSQDDPDSYQYFDCKTMIRDFRWSEFEVKEAWQLVTEQKVQLVRLESGFVDWRYTRIHEDDGMLRATADGICQNGKQQYSLHLEFGRNQVHGGYCTVRGCDERYGVFSQWSQGQLCKHLKALFILIYQELQRKSYGDATSLNAVQLLNRFNRNKANMALAASEISNTPNDLTFYPRLQLQDKNWSLSFKIGGSKSYVVKNIPELVSQIRNKETVTFGKKTEWNLSLDHFTEEGRRYYEFLKKNVEEDAIRQSQQRFYSGDDEVKASFKDSFPVYGHDLDTFMQLAGDQSFEIIGSVEGYRGNMTRFQERAPKIQLKIQKQVDQNQVFHGIQLQGTVPQFIKGEKYMYYVGDDTICYFEKSLLDELEPFLASARGGMIDMKIGRNQLGAFYYKVLPWLKQYVDVQENDAGLIQKYLPPEVAFVFYLDAESGVAYCRGEAAYGEWTMPLSEVLHPVNEREIQSFRDTAREEEAAFWMENYFPEWDAVSGRMFCDEENQLYDLLSQGISRLMEIGEVHVSEAFQRLKIQRRPKISVGVSVESSIMDLSITSEDLSMQELLELLQSYRKNKKYHRLRDGSYVSLESEDIAALDQMMNAMHIPLKEMVKGKMQIPVYRALYLDKMLESMDTAYIERDKRFKTLIKDFKTVSDSDYEVPESLQRVLRGYQKEGYRWLCTLDSYGLGGILADDMGLGKTLQVICLLLSKQGSGVSLIVAPASLVYNWGEELRRFAPELKVQLITGTQAERRSLLKDWQSNDVLVTSYDLLKRDIAEYEDLEFTYEIIDEAQYIKTHTTAAAKAVKVVKSRVRYALTGTPIENRLSELWSIFDYLMPGYLYGYDTFRKEIELPIVKNKDEAISERLKKMVAPFILRRLKQQVLKDLPDKLEEVRYAKLEHEQQKLYDGQVVHMKNLIEKTEETDFQKQKIQILAELTKIRQICSMLVSDNILRLSVGRPRR